MAIKARAEMNKMGHITVSAKSRAEPGKRDDAYLQSESDVQWFMDDVVPPKKRRDLDQGWAITFLMDEEIADSLFNYDSVRAPSYGFPVHNPKDDDEDEENARPDFEGNYTITDRPRGGYDVVIDGKDLGNFDDFDEALIAIAQRMVEEKYYPDVYFINDHGNVDLLSFRVLKSGKVKSKIVKSWV